MRSGAWIWGLGALMAATAASAAPAIRAGAPRATTEGLGSVAEYVAHVDLTDLGSASTLVLALPGRRLEAERVAVTQQPYGVFWKGRLPGGAVYLTTVDGSASGLIETAGVRYELFPGSDGTLRLAELDPARFPGCATEDGRGGVSSALPPPVPNALPPSSNAVAPGPTIMDALVVYTPQARSGVGGESQIRAVVQNAVNITNSAYANSQIDARLHLIHTQEVPIDDSGSSGTDLVAVRTSTTVAALRDLYGADLVGLIVHRNDACGRGYVQRSPGSGFARLAFQVTTRSCAVGNLSFAHEFGHNQGCEHDPANGTTPTNASFPWAFGHFHSGRYRTVMSYSNQCSGGCGRAPFFSNANVLHQSLTTGVLDQRENYRTINATAPIISDFRAAAVRLDFDQASYRVSENDAMVQVTVARTGLADVPVTVFVTTDEDQAEAGRDFVSTTATLTWSAGDTSTRIVEVPLLDDREREASEGFDLVLNRPLGAGLGTVPVARITIDDYEEGLLRFSAPTVEVRENTRSLTVRVERQNGGNGDVAVDWASSDDTALAGADYVAASGQLSWPDGDARAQTLTLDLLDDEDVEGPETFVLRLSEPSGGAALGADAELVVTVLDWEEGIVSLAQTELQVVENAGTLVLPFSRAQGSDGEVAVAVGFGPAAGPGVAAPDVDFQSSAAAVTFADGATTATLTLSIIDDTLQEGEEQLFVAITSAEGGARIGTARQASVRIQDWEEGEAAFAVSEAVVDEDAGTFSLEIQRTGGTDGAASVGYRSVAGTAAASQDFTATSGRVEWAAGEDGARSISVPILDDTEVEGEERFAIRLEAPEGMRLAAVSELDVQINDREPGMLSLEVAEITLEETAAPDAQTVRVVREQGSLGEVRVRWALRGVDALAGEDFVAGEGELIFADRATEQTVSFALIDDLEPEDTETFTLELSAPTGGAALGAVAATTIRITDAGGGQIMANWEPARGLFEDDGIAVLNVERLGETHGALTLEAGIDDSSTASSEDLGGSLGTLTWADGEGGTKRIEVAITNDELDEGDEMLAVAFSTPRTDVVLPDAAPLLLIRDDDGGCTCAASPSQGPAPWGLAVVLGLLIRRRRRR